MRVDARVVLLGGIGLLGVGLALRANRPPHAGSEGAREGPRGPGAPTPHPGPWTGDPATVPERPISPIRTVAPPPGLPPIGPRVLDPLDQSPASGKRGEALHPGAFEPPQDPDRHRFPGPPPPPVEAPNIFVRREGEPPHPSGGSPNARLLDADPESVDPAERQAAAARFRAAIGGRTAAITACFDATPPALEFLVAPMTGELGGYRGFVQAVSVPGGELTEPAELCVVQALEDIELETVPAPLTVRL